MLLENFANGLDTIFKETFTDDFIKEIIDTINQNKVAITDSKLTGLSKKYGIYVFFMKKTSPFKDFKELESTWNEKDFIKFPKAIKSNFDKSIFENGCYTFYVGKSEDLSKRIQQHLIHDNTNSTYGLKLKNRKNFSINDFYVGYWCLENETISSSEIKQFIITTLEQRIRKVINPLIGKK